MSTSQEWIELAPSCFPWQILATVWRNLRNIISDRITRIHSVTKSTLYTVLETSIMWSFFGNVCKGAKLQCFHHNFFVNNFLNICFMPPCLHNTFWALILSVCHLHSGNCNYYKLSPFSDGGFLFCNCNNIQSSLYIKPNVSLEFGVWM